MGAQGAFTKFWQPPAWPGVFMVVRVFCEQKQDFWPPTYAPQVRRCPELTDPFQTLRLLIWHLGRAEAKSLSMVITLAKLLIPNYLKSKKKLW